MKKATNKIAVILMAIFLITSFEFVGVFAESEASDTTADDTVLTTQEDNAEGGLTLGELTTYSSYESVWLEWDPVEGASGYNVYKNNSLVKGTPKLNSEGNKYEFRVTGLSTVNSKGKTISYTFKVVPYDANGVEGTGAEKKDAAVRNITYKVKIKTSGTLQNHGKVSGYSGKRAKTYKVTAGQWLYADRFGAGGKYIFNYKGSVFYCDRLRTSTRTAIYSKKLEYTREEAEHFVNDKKLTSKKKRLVWVNTYTQHIYLFKGSKGNWKCYLDGECSTGSASTPTPTGITGKKAIYKKIPSRHGIPYWSPFSDINSIHGKKSSWKLGKPASNGCVRNYNKNAKKVYEDAKVNTAVYIF